MASLIPNRCAGGLGKCHPTAAGAEHGSVSPPRRRTSPAEMEFPRQGLPAGLGGAGGGGLHQRSRPPKGNLRPSGVWGLLFTRSRRFRALAPQGPTQETKAAEDGRWGGVGGAPSCRPTVPASPCHRLGLRALPGAPLAPRGVSLPVPWLGISRTVVLDTGHCSLFCPDTSQIPFVSGSGYHLPPSMWSPQTAKLGWGDTSISSQQVNAMLPLSLPSCWAP